MLLRYEGKNIIMYNYKTKRVTFSFQQIVQFIYLLFIYNY